MRMALGVRDEAEIRGHRKTYIGALPGKLILKNGKSWRKTPSSCLMRLIKCLRICEVIRRQPC